jgi:hypothetical protein
MKYITFFIFMLLLQVNVYGLNGDIRGGFGSEGYGGGDFSSPSIDHGWGWYEHKVCKCEGDPCCLASCNFDYCQKKNGIGTIAGPAPECIHLQQQKIELCQTADILYNTHDQNADGESIGEVLVKVTALGDSPISTAQVATEIPITMYELEVNQGIFLDTGINKISFKLNDYLKKRKTFRYKVYDCNDETIINK